MQLDEFFAVPVSVKEVYAKTVPGILRAHEHICAQVRKTVGESSKANAVMKSCKLWLDPRYYPARVPQIEQGDWLRAMTGIHKAL